MHFPWSDDAPAAVVRLRMLLLGALGPFAGEPGSEVAEATAEAADTADKKAEVLSLMLPVNDTQKPSSEISFNKLLSSGWPEGQFRRSSAAGGVRRLRLQSCDNYSVSVLQS